MELLGLPFQGKAWRTISAGLAIEAGKGVSGSNLRSIWVVQGIPRTVSVYQYSMPAWALTPCSRKG